jgi:hypothetical protein
MNPRPPRQSTRKATQKRPKLKLNKESLKDLTAAGKEIKGGRMGGDTELVTCSCGGCS